MASCDTSKAEVLNTFFSSVFANEDTTNIPDFEHLPYNTQLTELNIIQDDVRVQFKRLKKSKSPGPDGLHSCVLSELEEQLIEPFRQVFTKLMAEGEIPQDWKEGLVTPIFKKGKHHIPGNYRPVSLTSITCKMMERLVKNAIMEHLTTNNLLSERQHGFILGRSCTTQLLATPDYWTSALEDHANLDAVYLDFAKAFDTPPPPTIDETARLRNRRWRTTVDQGFLDWTPTEGDGEWQHVSMGSSLKRNPARECFRTHPVHLLHQRHATPSNIRYYTFSPTTQRRSTEE